MKKSCLPLISLFGLCLLTACGGSGGPAIPPFGPITQFSVSAPATATAGTAISVIVTARDASNNVVANYTGTVQFSSSDGQAALPTPMALRNGTGTFQVTFKTVPAQTIMVVDTATGLIAGNSGAITVNAGPVSQLVFMVPGSATTGLAVNLTVT